MATRKNADGRPEILSISPAAAIPGGEFQVFGRALARSRRPKVTISDTAATVIVGSDSRVVARVPEGASPGNLVVENGEAASASVACEVGALVADGMHPVANPAIDAAGNIFTTFSGSRGQKTQVSVYRIDLNYEIKPFLTDIMNATGLAFGPDGQLYISSRNDGIVYRASPSGEMAVFVEGMGTATGLAFDRDGNLYVGDRSGTVFKISPGRQIYVFATLEPSISAYHLAFSEDGHLFVTGPTTSSFDSVFRVSPSGEVSVFYRGLGRPQGMAFDAEGRLYVAASLGGRKGVVRFAGDEPELFVSGPGVVGVAFAPSRAMVLSTNSAIYRIDLGIKGLPLP